MLQGPDWLEIASLRREISTLNKDSAQQPPTTTAAPASAASQQSATGFTPLPALHHCRSLVTGQLPLLYLPTKDDETRCLEAHAVRKLRVWMRPHAPRDDESVNVYRMKAKSEAERFSLFVSEVKGLGFPVQVTGSSSDDA